MMRYAPHEVSETRNSPKFVQSIIELAIPCDLSQSWRTIWKLSFQYPPSSGWLHPIILRVGRKCACLLRNTPYFSWQHPNIYHNSVKFPYSKCLNPPFLVDDATRFQPFTSPPPRFWFRWTLFSSFISLLANEEEISTLKSLMFLGQL